MVVGIGPHDRDNAREEQNREDVDLADRVPPRLIGIARHRDRHRTRAAEAFVELAQGLTAGFDAAEAA